MKSKVFICLISFLTATVCAEILPAASNNRGSYQRLPPPLQSDALSNASASSVDFGSNVFVADASMDMSYLQSKIDALYRLMKTGQFSSNRYAFFFKSGSYRLHFPVGFYTHAAGLGLTPDAVKLSGSLISEGWLPKNNSTCNFWRSVENLSIEPDKGKMKWAVSQASPMRRLHVIGDLELHDNNGWASGGFISDSLIDLEVRSGSQQQWFTRNSRVGSWEGAVWNMLFSGVDRAPQPSWPNPPFTVIRKTPVVREKPFLCLNADEKFCVFVPELIKESRGVSWNETSAPGKLISIDDFYIAKPENSSALIINQALAAGKNILFTPGLYFLKDTIHITRSNTVILGLGFANLVSAAGKTLITSDDVPGIIIAGLLFDAGEINTPVLMEIGKASSKIDHSKNPASLHDVFFRVGGAFAGKADLCLRINSCNVIGDNFWIWRADHGVAGTVAWDINTSDTGLEVNGDNITIYGLFVEHFQKYQTVWNGENGRTYFYQSELPYDVPNQASWMSIGSMGQAFEGYASYKVSDKVTKHLAMGLGVYSVFKKTGLALDHAIEVPETPGIVIRNMVTTSLGKGDINIRHILNNKGKHVGPTFSMSTLKEN